MSFCSELDLTTSRIIEARNLHKVPNFVAQFPSRVFLLFNFCKKNSFITLTVDKLLKLLLKWLIAKN